MQSGMGILFALLYEELRPTGEVPESFDIKYAKINDEATVKQMA